MKRVAPKGCIVHRITLNRTGAEVGYRCGDEGAGKWFTYPGGVTSNYRFKQIKGVRTIAYRGAYVSGTGASIGFVLSPASAVCHRDGMEIRCRLKGDTSSTSLRGRR